MGQLINPNRLIVSPGTNEIITIVLHTTQMAQVVNLPKVQTKTILDVGCDHLGLKHVHHSFYPCLASMTKSDYYWIGGACLKQNITIECCG